MRKFFISLSLAVSLSGCTTVLLKYDSSIQLRDNKEVYYTFEKPINISGTAIGCYLTFFMYGGWCWSYFLVPFEQDRKDFIIEAHDRMEAELKGRWFMIGDERLTRESLFETRFKSQLYNSEGDPVDLKPVPKPKRIKESQKLEEEILSYQFKKQSTLDHPDYTLYLLGDLGSDYSYHGSGVAVGYKWTYFMMSLGLGLQNRGLELANPISLSAAVETKPFFFGFGFSYYRGNGVHNVQFTDNQIYQAGVEYEYVFAHASAGTYIIQNALSNYQITLELGLGSAVYDDYNIQSAVDLVPEGLEPEGIAVGSDATFSKRMTKRGSTAPFVRLALIYWLREVD
jgi:hypothetical protein